MLDTVINILNGKFENEYIRVSVKPDILFSMSENNGRVRIDFKNKLQVEIKKVIYIKLNIDYIEVDENNMYVKVDSRMIPITIKMKDVYEIKPALNFFRLDA